MIITICGSMSFFKEMKEAADALNAAGHTALLPDGLDRYLAGELVPGVGNNAERKKADDLIRAHYNLIEKSDAILVLNYDKNGVKNYIGGNAFLELGFAHILDKKIYLLNDVPELAIFNHEIVAMEPTILQGDLKNIKT